MSELFDKKRIFHPDFGSSDAWGGTGTWGNNAHGVFSAADPSLTLGAAGGIGSIGDSYGPMNSMMGSMFDSDISAGLRGIDRTNSGGGNSGGFLSGDYKFGTSFGNLGGGVGSGFGFGNSSWSGQSTTGGLYSGRSAGLGGVGSFRGAWDLMGFGQDSSLNGYRGVSGSAYSFNEPTSKDTDGNSIPGRTGIGAEDSYTPIGIANSSTKATAGSLGSIKADVGSGYLDKHSVSVQAGKDTDGTYFDDAMFAKRTGVENASVAVDSKVGSAKLKVGHASTGDEWKAGGTYNPFTGSFEGHGSWTGGGYKVQDGTLDYSVGKNLLQSHASVESWDTTDTYGGGAGWDAKRGVAFTQGTGSWGGSTLKGGKFDVATRNKGAWANGDAGTFVTGGYDVKGGVEIDPTARSLTATGGGRGGGLQLKNAKLGYGIDRLAGIEGSIDKFSNDTIIDDAKYTHGAGKESVSVGKIDGMGMRFGKADLEAKSDFIGLDAKAGWNNLSTTNILERAHVDFDDSNLKDRSSHGGFDKLSGGWSSKKAHAEISGPFGTNAAAKLGSFNQSIECTGGHFDLSSKSGLDIGLDEGMVDAATMSNLDAKLDLGALASVRARLGEGSYNHVGAANAKVGLSRDKGLYAGLEHGGYRYLAGKDVADDISMFGGAVKQSARIGEGSVGGVDIGTLDYDTTLANSNLTASNVAAHGLKLKDLDLNHSVGKLGYGMGASQLNALDLNIGKMDAHLKNFGAAGNASAENAQLDVLNVKDGQTGVSWGGKEALGVRGSLRGGLGIDQAGGSYDVLAGKADTQFKNVNASAQLRDGQTNLFGHSLAIPDMGYKANASGGVSVDLIHGAANANLSLAGSSANFAGRNLTLGDWAQASGGMNTSQGAVNLALGGQHGLGADLNLAQRNLDLNVFGHKFDVDQGIRDAGSAVSRGAHAAWDFATSW